MKHLKSSNLETRTTLRVSHKQKVITMANGKLSELIGRAEIAPSTGSGNYHKKAIPFDLDNQQDVARIEAICALFNNPWTTGREYKRANLAADLGDFAIKILNGELEVVTAEEFEKLVAPIREKAEKQAEKAEVKAEAETVAAANTTYGDMSNKQLRTLLKSRGLPTKGSKKVLIERLETDDETEEAPEEVPSDEPEEVEEEEAEPEED